MLSFVMGKKIENTKEPWSFGVYHDANPHVYAKFKTLALQAIKSNQRCGAKMILEVMRWKTTVEGNDLFKVNNNTAPHYARLFEEEYPQHAGYFRKRGLKNA